MEHGKRHTPWPMAAIAVYASDAYAANQRHAEAPRVTMIRRLINSTCRSDRPHASNSSGAVRFSGGRHFTTLVM